MWRADLSQRILKAPTGCLRALLVAESNSSLLPRLARCHDNCSSCTRTRDVNKTSTAPRYLALVDALFYCCLISVPELILIDTFYFYHHRCSLMAQFANTVSDPESVTEENSISRLHSAYFNWRSFALACRGYTSHSSSQRQQSIHSIIV